MNAAATRDFLTNAAPELFDTVATDLMTIMGAGRTSDGAGGQATAWVAVNATPIKCLVQTQSEVGRGQKAVVGDKITAVTQYKITFPRAIAGVLVDCQESDRIKIAARAPEPEKLFTIVHFQNSVGVYIEAFCEIQDQ